MEKPMITKTIKGRIMFFVTLSMILIISVTAIINSVVLNRALKTSEHNALVAEAEGTSDVIDEWLLDQAHIIETMKCALEGMDKDDPEAIMDFLEDTFA